MYETLMEAAVAEENCKLAVRAVRRNDGAAGIDRMTTAELEPHLEANWWILSKDKLLKGDLRSEPGEAEGNPEAETGVHECWEYDGTGSVHTATVVASADADIRSGLQRA